MKIEQESKFGQVFSVVLFGGDRNRRKLCNSQKAVLTDDDDDDIR